MGVARKGTETALLKYLPEQPDVVRKYNDRQEIHEKSLITKTDDF